MTLIITQIFNYSTTLPDRIILNTALLVNLKGKPNDVSQYDYIFPPI